MKKKISLDLDNLSSENCRKLDMIYFKSQKSFLFFLENVFKKTNGNKKWILSSIFSRDYYQSRLYLNLCYLKLIDDLYKKTGTPGQVECIDHRTGMPFSRPTNVGATSAVYPKFTSSKTERL